MSISKISVKRPHATLMVMLIILLFGVISLTNIPMDLMPSMEAPVSLVMVNYPDASPEDVLEKVTKPIEQQIGSVSNIKNVQSTSREGSAIIFMEFNYGTDMDEAIEDVRNRIDMVEGSLPNGTSSPTVIKMDMNSMPIITLNFSSDTLDLADLYNTVDDKIVDLIEPIEGVASLNLSGGLEEVVKITVNQETLLKYGLTLNQISSALQSENVSTSNGTVDKGSKELIVRTVGKLESVDDIKALPIKISDHTVAPLGTIASVEHTYQDQNSISRLNGDTCITLSITKQSDANTVSVSRNVIDAIDSIEKQYPEVNIHISSNSADDIMSSLKGVAQNLILGALLAVFILFLFLQNFSSTAIIALAVPSSILTTFALMKAGDLTLNMLSLGGLTLGTGMLLDNSIVVLENVYRLRENGYSKSEASVHGARTITSAIVASTLTTLAVFLPIVFFTEGMISMMFKDFVYTIAFSLIASLVVALTVIPMLASKYLGKDTIIDSSPHEAGYVKKAKGIHKIMNAIAMGYEKISVIYTKALDYCLNRRKRFIVLAIILFIVSLNLLKVIGFSLFTSTDESSFTVNISTPYGTSLEEQNEIILPIEEYILNLPELENCSVQVSGGGGFFGSSSNSSSITVNLISRLDRERSTSDIVNAVRQKFSNLAGVEMTVSASAQMRGFSGSDVSIGIKGFDVDTLRDISSDIQHELKKISGLRNIDSDVEDGDPEVRIKLNKTQAAHYGVSSAQISQAIQSALNGTTATTLTLGGNEVDVDISLPESTQKSVENIKQIMIQTSTGRNIPIAQVASFEYSNSPVELSRDNQETTVTVTASLNGIPIQQANEEVNKVLNAYQIPEGYSFDIGGQQRSMNESFSSLGIALLIAILLVYMILVAQFESFSQPFIIMMSIPFAFTGSFLGLFIVGKALSVTAFIGLIMLAGIVVNNGIVLVDTVNQKRQDDLPLREALMLTGQQRLRPILMTTLTTILAMLPMSIGLGEAGEMMAPVGICVMFGLLVSSLITLILIPILYFAFENRKEQKKLIKAEN